MKEKIFKKGIKKRLLSAVLTLAMVFGLMPISNMTVYAAGTGSTDYTTLGSVIDGEDTGDVCFSFAWEWNDKGDSSCTHEDYIKWALLKNDWSRDTAITNLRWNSSVLLFKIAGETYNRSLYIGNTHTAWANDPTICKLCGKTIPHDHINHYGVTKTNTDNDTLTWYCEDGDCPTGISSANPIKLTLTASDANYSGSTVSVCTDGTDETAAIKYNLSTWTDSGAAAPVVKYYGRGETPNPTDNAAPSAVGTYTVKIYPTGYESTVISADFEILPPPTVADYNVVVPTGVIQPDSTAIVTEVTSSDTEWGKTDEKTWYVVNDSLTIDNQVKIKGNVNLILSDNKTLTMNDYIYYANATDSLTIWGQSNGTGKLDVKGKVSGTIAIEVPTVIVNGGMVEAKSEYNAGIKASTILTVNGGKVKATGGPGIRLESICGMLVKGGVVEVIGNFAISFAENANLIVEDTQAVIANTEETAAGASKLVRGTGWKTAVSGKKYIKIAPAHEHADHYGVATTNTTNDTLTWYCGAGCPSGAVDVAHAVKLTLSASSANYSGSAVTYDDTEFDKTAAIQLTGKTAWTTTAGLAYEVKYYTAYTDETTNIPTNSDDDGASETGAAPVNAGSYVVVLKAKEGGTVKKTLSKTFSINTVTITSDFITLGATSIEHTGSEITNTVTVKNGNTTLTESTDYTLEGNKGTAKGEYTVSVAGQGNYTGTATKTWNIVGAIPTITTPPTVGEITYGQKLSDSTLTGGVAQKDTTNVPGTFEWKTPNTVPAVSDSGTTNYTIVFTPTNTDTYATVEYDATVTVNPKELTAADITITAPSSNGSDLGNSVVVKFGSTTLVKGTEYDVTYAPAEVKEAGEYKATITFKGNYSGTNVEKTFTVSKPSSGGGSSSPTVTVPVSGDEHSVNVSASVSGTTATVNIKDADIEKITHADADTGVVEIDLSGLKQDVNTAKIPTKTVEKIAEAIAEHGNDTEGVSVKLSTATVTFDGTATQAISEQAKGNTIEIKVDEADKKNLTAEQKSSIEGLGSQIIVEATVVSNGQKISDFKGGSAEVSIPYTLKNAQKANGLVVFFVADDGSVEKVPATYVDGNVVFTVKHFSHYVVAYSAVNAFTDVAEGAYYYDAVKWAVENGITKGTSATTFSPDGLTTRAQVVTFLWRAAGCPTPKGNASKFTDIVAGEYYETAVAWAVENGITNGATATTFSPDAECTRAQVVTFLYRFNGANTLNIKDNPFSDVPEGKFYYDAVLWAAENGITSGTTATTFSPVGSCTRGQSVTFLYRLLNK